MKHTSLVVTTALAIAVFALFAASAPSSSAQTVLPNGAICPANTICTPINSVNGTAAVGGYIPGSWYAQQVGGTGIPDMYSKAGASPTVNASDLKATNLGVGVNGNLTTSSPDSQPTVTVSGNTITQTQYNANGTVRSVANYSTTLPSNNGITTSGSNVTYTAYKSCTLNNGTCYQGNGSVTITNVGSVSAMPCTAGMSCIDGMPAPSATSIRPMPACRTAISLDAANRLVAIMPSASSLLNAQYLHLAALAKVGTSSVSQSLVPRTGDVFSINPNFDSSKLSPNVISQTRTTSTFAKAVFDLCLDAGYTSNAPSGLNAAAVISANTPATQYVIFSVPQ